MPGTSITVSVVSHGQIDLVNQLLGDFATKCASALTIVLTHNIPEPAPTVPQQWRHGLEIIANERPKGFGANHNAAFRRCTSPIFCVVNPDIRLVGDPFPELTASLRSERVALVGPQVHNPDGRTEDSARKFPTLRRLLQKAVSDASGPEYPVDQGAAEVDWVAGMFMLMRSKSFAAVGGFDERFFLYYEDVDLCRRLRSMGFAIVFDPQVVVVHDARRASRRDPRLMRIHAASALRYLLRRYP